MAFPVVPVAVGTLAVAGFGVEQWRRRKRAVSVDVAAQRAVVFEVAINSCKDPGKILLLADAFDEAGQGVEADMLRKRAALMSATPEVKAARKEALEKGLASTKKDGVLKLANAFEELGATVAAEKLRAHAGTLEK